MIFKKKTSSLERQNLKVYHSTIWCKTKFLFLEHFFFRLISSFFWCSCRNSVLSSVLSFVWFLFVLSFVLSSVLSFVWFLFVLSFVLSSVLSFVWFLFVLSFVCLIFICPFRTDARMNSFVVSLCFCWNKSIQKSNYVAVKILKQLLTLTQTM